MNRQAIHGQTAQTLAWGLVLFPLITHAAFAASSEDFKRYPKDKVYEALANLMRTEESSELQNYSARLGLELIRSRFFVKGSLGCEIYQSRFEQNCRPPLCKLDITYAPTETSETVHPGNQQGVSTQEPTIKETISVIPQLTTKEVSGGGSDTIENLPADTQYETTRFQCLNDRRRCLASGEDSLICAGFLAACLVMGN